MKVLSILIVVALLFECHYAKKSKRHHHNKHVHASHASRKHIISKMVNEEIDSTAKKEVNEDSDFTAKKKDDATRLSEFVENTLLDTEDGKTSQSLTEVIDKTEEKEEKAKESKTKDNLEDLVTQNITDTSDISEFGSSEANKDVKDLNGSGISEGKGKTVNNSTDHFNDTLATYKAEVSEDDDNKEKKLINSDEKDNATVPESENWNLDAVNSTDEKIGFSEEDKSNKTLKDKEEEETYTEKPPKIALKDKEEEEKYTEKPPKLDEKPPKIDEKPPKFEEKPPKIDESRLKLAKMNISQSIKEVQ